MEYQLPVSVLRTTATMEHANIGLALRFEHHSCRQRLTIPLLQTVEHKLRTNLKPMQETTTVTNQLTVTVMGLVGFRVGLVYDPGVAISRKSSANHV